MYSRLSAECLLQPRFQDGHTKLGGKLWVVTRVRFIRELTCAIYTKMRQKRVHKEWKTKAKTKVEDMTQKMVNRGQSRDK